MKLRRISFALAGLLVMALPVLAADYYHTRVAPRINSLAEAEQTLPPTCGKLERQLHRAFMHDLPAGTYMRARADRENGLRLCAAGAEKEGALKLKDALRDIGIKPKT